jgi:hypothetical protein
MKFILASALLLFSIKSYAYRFTPLQEQIQDRDYQNWKESQRQKLRKKRRLAKKRKLAKRQKTTQYRQVISRQKITSEPQLFGWESARLQTSLGYAQGAMTSSDSYSGGTNGFRIDIGSHFDLSENWTTTTFARVNLDTVNEESINAPFGLANVEAKAYDFGIAQRFLYRASFKETKISPFIDAHVGRGFFTINESEQLSTGTATAKTEFLYTKVAGSIGLQFHFENLLPFVKFEYGAMVFDDVVGYEVKNAAGESNSGNSIIEKTETLNYTFNSFTGGISYLF